MARQTIDLGAAADDGSGEGLRNGGVKINENFIEVYDDKRFGVYNYDNNLGPLSVASSTWTHIPNNGLGANTILGGALAGVDIYNTITDQVDYTGLDLYDTVDFRFDSNVTTTSANQVVRVRLVISYGVLNIPLTFISEQFKTAGSNPLFGFLQSHLFSNLVKDNPARFEIWSDASCTLDLNGYAIKAIKRTL